MPRWYWIKGSLVKRCKICAVLANFNMTKSEFYIGSDICYRLGLSCLYSSYDFLTASWALKSFWCAPEGTVWMPMCCSTWNSFDFFICNIGPLMGHAMFWCFCNRFGWGGTMVFSFPFLLQGNRSPKECFWTFMKKCSANTATYCCRLVKVFESLQSEYESILARWYRPILRRYRHTFLQNVCME